MISMMRDKSGRWSFAAPDGREIQICEPKASRQPKAAQIALSWIMPPKHKVDWEGTGVDPKTREPYRPSPGPWYEDVYPGIIGSRKNASWSLPMVFPLCEKLPTL
jgi:hypothetical protein